MEKLYVLRHVVYAKSIMDAIVKSKKREPDEVFVSDEWLNKIGFVKENDIEVRGLINKRK